MMKVTESGCYDLVIKNAKIVDGTGNPWFKADIGVSDDTISKIGQLEPREENADRVIDADGKIVAPGFIDPHGHSDLSILVDHLTESKVHQGVTTEVIGNCGSSAFPIRDEHLEDLKKQYSFMGELDIEWDWRTAEEYIRKVESGGISMNVAPLVGHGTVRIAAMGFDDRSPDEDELEAMKAMVRQGMQAGAFGLSTGLIYPPGSYSSTQELIDLTREISEFQGIYCSHVRGESDDVLQAIEEAINIGKAAEVGVQISHHKVAGKQNWGMSEDTLSLLESAREDGIDVTSDQYPYTAGSTGLSSLLPDWVHEGGVEDLLDRLRDEQTREQIRTDIKEDRIEGWWNPLKSSGWDRVMVVGFDTEKNQQFEGKTLAEISEKRDQEEYQTLFDLLLEEKAGVRMILFMIDSDDVETILRHPTTMVGTDGRALSPTGVFAQGKTHPRAYGTYPRILGKYVRENQVLSLSEAIRKMTSLPAQKLGLKNRGCLKEGFKADLVIFNPSTVMDSSTYQDPHRLPQGISQVIVNGKRVVKDSIHTGEKPGRVIKNC